ncbi:LiaF transmembrane domain-containing protein [Anaerosporobacter faecicola]|uniref:LiaF transmembrane domain-containing protein n=1 Tax=Anaerosporobacter faecicola TaxID=2718714 RepID=UPI00143BE08E|nr:LiaF domain-containing protein [Anaerosporobacter faecicola]
MKRNATGYIWGLIIIALGVLIGAKAFGADFDIFFDGWWTLFIIVPCAVGLFEHGDRTGSLIGLGIGVMLLLAAQDFIPWNMFGKLIVAFIFVIIGIRLIFDGGHKNKTIEFHQGNTTSDNTYTYTYNESNSNNGSNVNNNDYSTNNTYSNTTDNNNNNTNANFNQGSNGEAFKTNYNTNVSAIFSGKSLDFSNQYFGGVAVTAIFGGIDVNLRNAIIDKDVIIDVTAVFGGIDIYVPTNVRVVTNCTPILGGVDNKTCSAAMTDGMNMPTVYVNGACIFGGVDIK